MGQNHSSGDKAIVIELEREIEHLQAELERQRQHTALLRDVALACRGGADPQQVFEAIYERVRQVLPIDVFYVALCDRADTSAYRFVLFVDEGVRYDLPDRRVGGLTGYIMQQRRPLLFRDLHAERQPPPAPQPEAFGNLAKRSRAWLGVPILAGREAIGVLSIQSYTPAVFDDSDLELLRALADLAALAIENALLYEAQEQLSRSLAERVTARSEELAVMTAIATSFSQGLPLATLLDTVLERVLWLLGLDGGAIYLYTAPARLRREAQRDPDDALMPAELSLDDARLGRALVTSAPRDEHARERLLVTVPLRVLGRVVGVMLLHGPARELSEHERTLLEAASYQIAVGIDNARLLEQQARQIARLEALATIAAASSATLDPCAILERVAVRLQPLLACDGLLLATCDAQRQRLINGIMCTADGAAQPLQATAIDPHSRLARLLSEERPLLIGSADALHQALPPQADWEREARTWLGVPLQGRNGALIGALAIASRQQDAFDQRDLQFVSAVAHQLALDVENAQLFQAARVSAAIAEQRAENLALVHSISRLVNSSLDPQTVLGIASEQLAQLFEVDHCGIVLYDGEGWQGEVVAEYPALGALHLRVAFPNVEDFQNDLQYLGQPIYIGDVDNDPRTRPIRQLMARFGFRSMLIVPLISRGRAVGAIGLNWRVPHQPLAPEALDLCRTIAAQVANALENARLYHLSVTRIEQEMEIARAIQANLFPTRLPEIPGARLAARCVPARETGGDFFDVLPLDDNRFGLSIGDVSGKSLPAAMLMAVARSIVRSEALDHALPEDVMCQTNMLVAQDVPPDTYVALCYAVYDARSRAIDLALGGQLTPLLRHADGSVSFVDAPGELPLGIVPDVRYRTTRVKLQRGDSVLFYTDGLVEAFSPQGELFGFERLAQTFARWGGHAADEIVARLLEAVAAWQGDRERHDDVTVVVLQVI
ncbi:GAF domain-containing protein [Kallotenue papyrolyticum]|uniref:GAF domain-containing protein n=1 Tax=Kallotenue papyrolyticum TaxID=1325125 RepID=UPI0009DEB499|nr:GAF domain-containing protein [Kallotenue papyrolyticum]